MSQRSIISGTPPRSPTSTAGRFLSENLTRPPHAFSTTETSQVNEQAPDFLASQFPGLSNVTPQEAVHLFNELTADNGSHPCITNDNDSVEDDDKWIRDCVSDSDFNSTEFVSDNKVANNSSTTEFQHDALLLPQPVTPSTRKDPCLPTTSEPQQMHEKNPSATGITPLSNSNNISRMCSIQKSLEVENLEGKFIPQNTNNNNVSCRNALIRFINSDPRFNVKLPADDEDALFKFVLPCTPDNVQKDHLIHLNSLLKEFIVQYKTKDSARKPKPITINGYIQGFARLLQSRGYQFNIFTDDVFIDQKTGYRFVMDNYFAERQAEGAVTIHHNTIPFKEMKKLLAHDVCSMETACGYLNRLVFTMGLMIGLRPTALSNITLDQLQLSEKDGRPIIYFMEKVGGRDGTGKTKQGGIKFIKRSPQPIPIYNIEFMDGLINPFRLIVDYLKLRCSMGPFSNRFFLQVANKTVGKKRTQWFKKSPIGKNSFSEILKTMCREAGIRGDGLHDHLTNHSLRSSMINRLIETGHADSATVLRSNHASIDTLTRYHNLQSVEGFKQQFDLFNSNFTKLPFTRAELQPFIDDLQRGKANSKGVSELSEKNSSVPQSVNPSIIDQNGKPSRTVAACNKLESSGDVGSNSATGITNSVPTPTNSAINVSNADTPFSAMVGSIRVDGGQINVTINNTYK